MQLEEMKVTRGEVGSYREPNFNPVSISLIRVKHGGYYSLLRIDFENVKSSSSNSKNGLGCYVNPCRSTGFVGSLMLCKGVRFVFM